MELAGLEPATSWVRLGQRSRPVHPFAETAGLQGFFGCGRTRPIPSEP
jgi:hypothetical protein